MEHRQPDTDLILPYDFNQIEFEQEKSPHEEFDQLETVTLVMFQLEKIQLILLPVSYSSVSNFVKLVMARFQLFR